MMDDKDKLIKELQERIAITEAQKKLENSNGFPTPYNCDRCGMYVNFIHILPVIKKTGLCPGCYHDRIKEEKDAQTKV